MLNVGQSQDYDRATDNQLQQQVALAGERLRSAIIALLDELAHAGAREQKAIREVLDLSQSATSRLVSCVRVTDPLATLARVPGPEGLRKMLRGAARAGVRQECLEQVDGAIRCVERLIDEDVGDRDALDSLLCDWVHESRAGFELRHKCAAFKAMSALRGVQARILASCWLIHPSDQSGVYDTVEIAGLFGCRRIRPSGVLNTMTKHLSPEPHRFSVLSLAGQPVESVQDILVHDFCSRELGAIETRRQGTLTQTLVRGLPLGKGPGADFVTALFFRGLHRAARGPGDAVTTGVAASIEPPCADLVLDVFLHDDVWPGLRPELRIFDTVVRGLAHPEDPLRQADRLDMLESVVSLQRGASFRVAEIPRYAELIDYVCGRLNWSPAELRGYRCKIRYPVYGAMVCLAFPLPLKAATD